MVKHKAGKKLTNRLRFRRCQVKGCIMPKGHGGGWTIGIDGSRVDYLEPLLWHRTAEGWIRVD